MPFKSKDDRREWERSPEQVERALARKRRQREKQDLIARLNAVQTIVDRAGNDRFIGPGLRAQLVKYREEIVAYRRKRDEEVVQMRVVPVKDEESWSAVG